MSENLRVMNNRMVLLNPLVSHNHNSYYIKVSLLKKNHNNSSSLTPKNGGVVQRHGVQYVNSGGEETGDGEIT